MDPCCLQANLEGYFQQGLVTGNYSALKLTSLGKTFSSPSRQQQLTSSGQNRKKRKMMTKKGAREDSWSSHAVFPWRGLHFLLQRERGKHTDPGNGFHQRGQSPHFLTHTYDWVYLKGEKPEPLTKALHQELLLHIKTRLCKKKRILHRPTWELNAKAI